MAPSLTSLLLLLGSALPLAAQDVAEVDTHLGCVHMPVIHSTNTRVFEKRAVEVMLANRSDVAYYAQLDIGTPPQSVFVQLDTGSFELWVNPDCTKVSGGDAQFCEGIGHYDTTKSSTAKQLGTGKTLTYGIGSANISYVADTITLPGTANGLKGVQFGVATASNDQFSGILGIGYGQGLATKYKNFVDELVAQNATNVKAYTLALGSKDAQEGVIVFGGVDTSKFAGSLAKLPIIPAAQSPDQVPRFWVNMSGISLSASSGKNKTYANSSVPVFLDSGSTMTLLPHQLATAIAADFGAPEAEDGGFYQVDCAFTKTKGSLDFAFNGTTVRVPFSELVRVVESNPPTCFLGISPSASFTLLGDTFMRSAYTVFDLEGNNIWLAQAVNCGSTPAALSSVDVLRTLQGSCGTNNAALAPSSSAATSAAPTVARTSVAVAPSATVGQTAAQQNRGLRVGGSAWVPALFTLILAAASVL